MRDMPPRVISDELKRRLIMVRAQDGPVRIRYEDDTCRCCGTPRKRSSKPWYFWDRVSKYYDVLSEGWVSKPNLIPERYATFRQACIAARKLMGETF